MKQNIVFRHSPTLTDLENVREILTSTGFFFDFEIEVALELIKEYLQKGEESGYFFVFAEIEGKTMAYASFGPIPCTRHSYDLYWIGVHQHCRGLGIGGLLLQRCEEEIQKRGGKKVYIETSSTPKYDPTRKFYLSKHYKQAAFLEDYYSLNDGKYIYVKDL